MVWNTSPNEFRYAPRWVYMTPLGSAGGAGGVVDGDDGALVRDRPGQRRGIPVGLGQERLEAPLADFQPAGGETELGIGNLDDVGQVRRRRERVPDRADQLRIHEQHFGLGMVEDVVDLGLGQPGIEGHQHATGQRDGEVRDEQLGDVRGQDHHPVARFDAGLQGQGETLCDVGELGVGVTTGAVDDGLLLRVHLGGALQEAQRRERRIVGAGDGRGTDHLLGTPLSTWVLRPRG